MSLSISIIKSVLPSLHLLKFIQMQYEPLLHSSSPSKLSSERDIARFQKRGKKVSPLVNMLFMKKRF